MHNLLFFAYLERDETNMLITLLPMLEAAQCRIESGILCNVLRKRFMDTNKVSTSLFISGITISNMLKSHFMLQYQDVNELFITISNITEIKIYHLPVHVCTDI